MPKIFNTKIWIILLAAVIFFMIGWAWYGMLFMEKWMALEGMTIDDSAPPAKEMMIGFLISLLQALGLAGIIGATGKFGIGAGLKVGALAWLFFAVPLMAYRWNYAEGPAELFQIDIAHLLIGYLAMGAIYGLLRKPATVPV